MSATAEVSRKMERNTKLRRFPQGRDIDKVVLVGGATKMPCVQVKCILDLREIPKISSKNLEMVKVRRATVIGVVHTFYYDDWL